MKIRVARRRVNRLHAVAQRIEHAAALDRAGDVLTKAIRDTVAPGRVKDLLSGTWFGHSLHPGDEVHRILADRGGLVHAFALREPRYLVDRYDRSR